MRTEPVADACSIVYLYASRAQRHDLYVARQPCKGIVGRHVAADCPLGSWSEFPVVMDSYQRPWSRKVEYDCNRLRVYCTMCDCILLTLCIHLVQAYWVPHTYVHLVGKSLVASTQVIRHGFYHWYILQIVLYGIVSCMSWCALYIYIYMLMCLTRWTRARLFPCSFFVFKPRVNACSSKSINK